MDSISRRTTGKVLGKIVNYKNNCKEKGKKGTNKRESGDNKEETGRVGTTVLKPICSKAQGGSKKKVKSSRLTSLLKKAPPYQERSRGQDKVVKLIGELTC